MELPNWQKEKLNEAKSKLESLISGEGCSVFHDTPGSPKLDEQTKEQIKNSMRLYLETWVIPEIESVVLNKRHYNG